MSLYNHVGWLIPDVEVSLEEIPVPKHLKFFYAPKLSSGLSVSYVILNLVSVANQFFGVLTWLQSC